MPTKPYKEPKTTYTKSVVSIIVLLYFIGAAVGIILVVLSAITDLKNRGMIDPAMFIALAAYLATPTATAVAFYAWKSKAENLLKIRYSNEARTVVNCDPPAFTAQDAIPELIQTIANMGGSM